MRSILSLFVVLTVTNTCLSSQNSLLLNPDFETTTWPNMGWVAQTNTGNDLIVNEDNIICIQNDLTSHSGNYFVNLGGYQDASGLYNASLGQSFNVGSSGVAHLGFYYKYIRESVDPGSYVSILVDGIEVWSIAPHFIVDAEEDYVYISVDLGYLDAGQHTIELKAYEHPAGGERPMQFNFDDVVLYLTPNSSIETENTDLNLVYLPGSIQIQTNSTLDQEAQIELIDLSGKVVASTSTHFQTSYSLPVEFYTSGIYILNFRSEGFNTSKKIFIRH